MIRGSSKSIGPRADLRSTKKDTGGARRGRSGGGPANSRFFSGTNSTDTRFERFCVRRSHASRNSQKPAEIEIFIPAVEKRSAIGAITWLSALLLPVAWALSLPLSRSLPGSHSISSSPVPRCFPALYPPSFSFSPIGMAAIRMPPHSASLIRGT